MLFSYVLATNGHRKGKRIAAAQITSEIIKDQHIKCNMKVLLDGKTPPYRLREVEGAIDESEFVSAMVDKFASIRKEISPRASISITAFEKQLSRLIDWCRHRRHAFRLRFLRASLMATRGNNAAALKDLNVIWSDRNVLKGYPEFDYLVRHNRAILLILLGNVEGLSSLLDLFGAAQKKVRRRTLQMDSDNKKSRKQQNTIEEESAQNAKDETPIKTEALGVDHQAEQRDAKAGDDDSGLESGFGSSPTESIRGEKRDPAEGIIAIDKSLASDSPMVKIRPSKWRYLYLPTLIAVHEIVKKIEAIEASDPTYRPAMLKGFDSTELHELIGIKLEEMLQDLFVNSTSPDSGWSTLLWQEHLVIWPAQNGFVNKKKFIGFALLLNIDWDEDIITHILAEYRKVYRRDVEICLKAYSQSRKSCSEGRIIPALRHFVDARRRQKKYGQHISTADVEEAYNNCVSALIEILNWDQESIGATYFRILNRQDNYPAPVEEHFANLLRKLFNAVLDHCDRILDLLADDAARDNCARIDRQTAEFDRTRIGLYCLTDLMTHGYYDQRETLFEQGINALADRIQNQKNAWLRRVIGEVHPWGLDHSETHSWHDYVRAGWPALISEFCLTRIRWLLSKNMLAKTEKKSFEQVFQVLNAIIVEAEGHLCRGLPTDLGDEPVLDLADLKLSVSRLMDELVAVLKPDPDEPESPGYIGPIAQQVYNALKMTEKNQFPQPLDSDKRRAAGKLIRLFDHCYPENIPATCLYLEPAGLDTGFEILDRIRNLEILINGEPSRQAYRKRMARLQTIKAWQALHELQRRIDHSWDITDKTENGLWADRNAKVSGAELNGEIEKVKHKFEEVMNLDPNAPFILWGLSHLRVLAAGLAPWLQDTLLYLLGSTDKDLADIQKTEQVLTMSVPKGRYDLNACFNPKLMTRDRYNAFLKVVGSLEKDKGGQLAGY